MEDGVALTEAEFGVSGFSMSGTTLYDTACQGPSDSFSGEGTGTLTGYDLDTGEPRGLTLFNISIEGLKDEDADGYIEINGLWENSHTGAMGYFFSVDSFARLSPEGCFAQGFSFGAGQPFTFVGLESTELLDGELVDVVPPQARESEQCNLSGGDRIIDSTAQGVRKFVYVYQSAVDEVWVCARVEDTTTGEGYGGRLEATPTDADPQVTGEPGSPSTDDSSTACTTTTPNDVPGSHPIAFGGVGPVDYMVDAYADDSEAWVCLQVGSSHHRVVVPLGSGAPDVEFGTVASWHPDE